MEPRTDRQRLEIITILAYNEFYTSHKELFKKDQQEYWRQARQYKDQQIREYQWDLEKK
jgi:hypothetical protein